MRVRETKEDRPEPDAGLTILGIVEMVIGEKIQSAVVVATIDAEEPLAASAPPSEPTPKKRTSATRRRRR